MNRINQLFSEKQGNILSIYFTAGYPSLESTVQIIQQLADAGADMIEIGMPFSDPMADGPIIQSSSTEALRNGMTLKLLFEQLKNIRQTVHVPLLLMGYLNPVIQYGFEKFCADCENTGIDGLILPDLPLEVMESDILVTGRAYENLHSLFLKHNLYPVFLVSPQTSADRIRQIDAVSKGFIYMVSSSSTTGKNGSFGKDHVDYFARIRDMQLKNPVLAGFGISGPEQFQTVCKYVNGAVVGSAFIKNLSNPDSRPEGIHKFIAYIRH